MKVGSINLTHNINTIITKWDWFWYAPTPRLKLHCFRLVMGFSLLIYMSYNWQTSAEWLTTQGFHLTPELTTEQRITLSAPLLPEVLLPWFGIFYLLSTLSFLCGKWLRLSCPLVFCCTTYVTLADILNAFTINQLLIFSLAIVSLAEWRPTLPDEQRAQTIPSWPIRMLQIMFFMMYFGCGLTKVVQGDWLHDDSILWHAAHGYYRNELAVWSLNTLPIWCWSLLQHFALFVELACPWFLVFRRTRYFGLFCFIALQLGIALLMERLFFFSFQMFSLSLVFIDDLHLAAIQRKTQKLVTCLKDKKFLKEEP